MGLLLELPSELIETVSELGVEKQILVRYFVGAFIEANIPEVMMQAKVFDQKGIDHTRYTISFTNDVNVPKQGGVFGDCGILDCFFILQPGTDDRGCGYFIWKDDFMKRISSSGPSTPPSLYTRPSRSPSYYAGTSRSAMNVGKDECSNSAILHELYNDMGKLGLE
ncbi:hypothetical protein Tco_0599191 [Tanacetum coccineum]